MVPSACARVRPLSTIRLLSTPRVAVGAESNRVPLPIRLLPAPTVYVGAAVPDSSRIAPEARMTSPFRNAPPCSFRVPVWTSSAPSSDTPVAMVLVPVAVSRITVPPVPMTRVLVPVPPSNSVPLFSRCRVAPPSMVRVASLSSVTLATPRAKVTFTVPPLAVTSTPSIVFAPGVDKFRFALPEYRIEPSPVRVPLAQLCVPLTVSVAPVCTSTVPRVWLKIWPL